MSDVYIVGCGMTSKAAWKLIPPTSEVIFCNAAIEAWQTTKHPRNMVRWFVSDNKFIDTECFKHYYPCAMDVLWGSGQVAERITVEVEFQENPSMTPWDVKPVKGVYRAGGSVVGNAMHCAYWDCLVPVVVGVDMDGTKSLSHDGEVYKPGHWGDRRKMLDAFIGQYLPETVSLTPTTLDIKVI